MSHRPPLLVLLGFAVSILAGSGPAQCFSFRTIDVPGTMITTPYGINNHGQVVGARDSQSQRVHEPASHTPFDSIAVSADSRLG